MDESELFTLQDILRDPLVVHSLDDYINAYEEADDIKRIQKTLKKLLRFKKKNVNLFGVLNMLQGGMNAIGHNINRASNNINNITSDNINNTTSNTVSNNINNITSNTVSNNVNNITSSNINNITSNNVIIAEKKLTFPNTFDFTDGFFTFKSAHIDKQLTKEKMLKIFKNQFKRIEALRSIQLPKTVVNRNLSVSTSHSQLFKKIEKNMDLGAVGPRNSTDIAASSGFRNGMIKTASLTEKMQQTPSPIHSNASETNIVKATRSPCSESRQNPHEALLSPPQGKHKNPEEDEYEDEGS